MIGQAGRFVGQQAIQLHGGMGMTDELIVSHYFKRLTAIDLTFGDTDFHTAAVHRRDCRGVKKARRRSAALCSCRSGFSLTCRVGLKPDLHSGQVFFSASFFFSAASHSAFDSIT